MANRLDVYDFMFLRAASKAGPRGCAVCWDDVPRVSALVSQGLISRVPAEVDRPYGSAMTTAPGLEALAKHDHADHVETLCSRTIVDAVASSPPGDAVLESVEGGLRLRRVGRKPISASSVRSLAYALDFESASARG